MLAHNKLMAAAALYGSAHNNWLLRYMGNVPSKFYRINLAGGTARDITSGQALRKRGFIIDPALKQTSS